jgi:uncharacterized membrane protein YphA (DoxX/SURF4 family)
MKKFHTFISNQPSIGLLILRVVIGIVFVTHGVMKLNSIDMTAGFFSKIGIPAAGFFAWVVALVETVGGAALILGIGTTIVAILLGIVMLVAIFSAKLSSGFVGGYEFDVTLFAGLASLLLQGSGKYSLDSKFCDCESCQCDGSCESKPGQK